MVPEFVARTRGSKWNRALPGGSKWVQAQPAAAANGRRLSLPVPGNKRKRMVRWNQWRAIRDGWEESACKNKGSPRSAAMARPGTG